MEILNTQKKEKKNKKKAKNSVKFAYNENISTSET